MEERILTIRDETRRGMQKYDDWAEKEIEEACLRETNDDETERGARRIYLKWRRENRVEER